MSFGKNPHVAKAEAEEQKALHAKDTKAAELAWREAARQWDRAAARAESPKAEAEFNAKAESARAKADGRIEIVESEDESPAVPRELLN